MWPNTLVNQAVSMADTAHSSDVEALSSVVKMMKKYPNVDFVP